MRANTVGGLARTVPVAAAMGRMLRHLAEHPDAGLLGYQNWFGGRQFSSPTGAVPRTCNGSPPIRPHRTRPLGRSSTGNSRPTAGVGIWHELYTVRPGDFEGIYSNMPVFGMAAAGEHLPIGDGWRTSKQRMAAAARNPHAQPVG